MRFVVVVSSAIAAIGVAAPAYADPDGDDASFLAALKQAGITYASPDRAISAGKAVCDQLSDGATAPDLVHQLTSVNPGFTGNGAIKFAGIAASVYCPAQLQSTDSEGQDSRGTNPGSGPETRPSLPPSGARHSA
ncbi:DUF732 domain-containing protein [Mycobacterium sp. SM1]|uniref:DUF732 domain-containing protein n=1 Tax=Mycobacterium sp. SM1 TaxID=2816243 RepID=UPI001BCDA521|nr:DUF732 domain-containing protein [Mycobacterium sp. SM1]